ncbi:unnamed protein product, partial [Owenia fusiformis]
PENMTSAGRIFTKCHRFLSNSSSVLHKRKLLIRKYCSNEAVPLGPRDPGEVFITPCVQELLYRMTRLDVDKVFAPKLKQAKNPQYELIPESKLGELQERVLRKAMNKLQMPPVLKQRAPLKEVLEENPDIAGITETKYIFTDITYGISNKERYIVAREADGTLRKATHDERDRMINVYFPVKGRMVYMPKMFEEARLEEMLEEGKHLYVLNRAIIQFEPDSPDYIRVTQRTYEHIDSKKLFEDLRSTRHFGGLAFYLAWHKKIDHLLVDMLQRDLIRDAQDLVVLLNIIHPDSVSAQMAKSQNITDPSTLIKNYIEHDAPHAGIVELALQSYQDDQRQQEQHSNAQQS